MSSLTKTGVWSRRKTSWQRLPRAWYFTACPTSDLAHCVSSPRHRIAGVCRMTPDCRCKARSRNIEYTSHWQSACPGCDFVLEKRMPSHDLTLIIDLSSWFLSSIPRAITSFSFDLIKIYLTRASPVHHAASYCGDCGVR
jgi:hypothetical protein